MSREHQVAPRFSRSSEPAPRVSYCGLWSPPLPRSLYETPLIKVNQRKEWMDHLPGSQKWACFPQARLEWCSEQQQEREVGGQEIVRSRGY